MNKIGYKPLIALALAVFVSLVVVSAVPPGDQGNTIYVNNSWYEINESGKYLLTENLTHGIKITADDVTFDGNGYSICEDWCGIFVKGCSGVTIRDMQIFDCMYGIKLMCSSDCMVQKNEVSDTMYGIYLKYADENKIVNNVACGNGKGIYLVGSDENNIEANEASWNEWVGIKLDYCSDDNKVHGNTALENGCVDISADPDDNDVSGNKITPED